MVFITVLQHLLRWTILPVATHNEHLRWPAGTEAFGIQTKAADNLILTQRLYRSH
jgi:hypothetical protein